MVGDVRGMAQLRSIEHAALNMSRHCEQAAQHKGICKNPQLGKIALHMGPQVKETRGAILFMEPPMNSLGL